jgi:putative ABC transport system substrate-binding protein
MIQITRRHFITGLGATAAGLPLTVRAQTSRPVIGFLNGSSADGYAPMVLAFKAGLKEAGFTDGQNVTIEYRWAAGQYDRLPGMAADLVRRPVAVIIANTPANLVAKRATDTVPIVFTTSSDPVQAGLVTSLNQPDGNVTGVSQLNVEVGPKRLELARELLPANKVVALLVNPGNPQGETVIKSTQAAAVGLGLELKVLKAGTDADMETAFTGFAATGAGVLIIGTDGFFNGKTAQLARLSVRHAVPSIYQYDDFADNGGLMSYGGSIKDAYRTAGLYAGRILKGEKPGDLPVQQSTKVELILNLKTAKALGINVPLSLLGRADQIIE